MELKETIEMMQSEDYKERFKAEYHQLGIRVTKLRDFVDKYEKGELNFKPDCSITLLKGQIVPMCIYLDVLKERAKIEGIQLK